MKLYEIDRGIEECIDPETGEIIDLEMLDHLMMERDRKSDAVIQSDDADLSKLPEELLNVTIAPNKAEIKKALKAGEQVDGFSLETRQNIQIR